MTQEAASHNAVIADPGSEDNNNSSRSTMPAAPRSCLKTSSSTGSLNNQTAKPMSRGNESLPRVFNEMKQAGRRPQRHLDVPDVQEELSLMSCRARMNSGSTRRAMSSENLCCLEGNKTVRRRRRKQQIPSLDGSKTPIKGILRTSSMGRLPTQERKKSVSWSGLDPPCRWNSQGSGLNLKALGLNMTNSFNMTNSSERSDKGNFTWTKGKVESKDKNALRSDAASGFASLVQQEVNRQSLVKPKRRNSNESENAAKKPPSMPKREPSIRNMFQATVDDVQNSIRTEMATRNIAGNPPTMPKSKSEASLRAPRRPRRMVSLEEDTDQNEKTSPKASASVSDFESLRKKLGILNPPNKPRRLATKEFEDVAQAELVSRVQALKKNIATAPRTEPQVPVPASPTSSVKINGSTKKNVFQSQVSDFQTTIIGSMRTAKSTPGTTRHSIAA